MGCLCYVSNTKTFVTSNGTHDKHCEQRGFKEQREIKEQRKVQEQREIKEQENSKNRDKFPIIPNTCRWTSNQ